jgi:flagellar L-ring protein precursor FlgH
LPAALLLVLSAWIAAEVYAQSASMFGDSSVRPPLTLREYSWTYEKPPDVRPIQLHDLITILVDYRTRVATEGEMDRKKKTNADAVLADWILLKGLFHMIPDPQSAGDPKISAKLDNKFKAEAEIETNSSMTFSITCHVVDIRPNGNLIIEGHHSIRNNNEVWDCSLTGEVRDKDVNKGNNTVRSDHVANLRIHKRESGHVRDGYRRGWFLKFLDLIQPF